MFCDEEIIAVYNGFQESKEHEESDVNLLMII